jgi:hypothetical protein
MKEGKGLIGEDSVLNSGSRLVSDKISNLAYMWFRYGQRRNSSCREIETRSNSFFFMILAITKLL